jgi:hypothetical protein
MIAWIDRMTRLKFPLGLDQIKWNKTFGSEEFVLMQVYVGLSEESECLW